MLTHKKVFLKALQIMTLLCLFFTVTSCSKGETGTVSAGSDIDFTFEAEQTKADTGPSITAGIEIPGYDTLYIDYGSTTMEGDFFNPDANNVYFRISFYLADEEEAFYQSNLIAPGQHLYKLEMAKTFEKGIYDMSIVYETYTTDDNFTPRNGANVNCKLVVE